MEKKMFLLADDDVDDREMFCEALEVVDGNIQCNFVTNGSEAMSALTGDGNHPELIFLDINMPVMNGWECLEKLKADERYKSIPVIVMSTSSHKREVDIAKNLDAFCYFIKPYKFSELVQALKIIVSRTRSASSTQDDAGSKYVQILSAGDNNN